MRSIQYLKQQQLKNTAYCPQPSQRLQMLEQSLGENQEAIDKVGVLEEQYVCPNQQQQDQVLNFILQQPIQMEQKASQCSDQSVQSEIRLSNASSEDDLLDDKLSIIGILHKICTATGILVDNNIILTCAHAFELNQGQYCDSFVFIPGCSDKTALHHYKKQRMNQTLFCSSAKLQRFQKMAIGRELALIKLEEEYDVRGKQLQIIGIEDALDKSIEIVGYSNAKVTYDSQEETIHSKYIQRVSLKGQYVSINQRQHEISYALSTNPGLSGAPILAKYKDQKGEIRTGIVGLHTHGVKVSNVFSKGLAFTKEMKALFSIFYAQMQSNDLL